MPKPSTAVRGRPAAIEHEALAGDVPAITALPTAFRIAAMKIFNLYAEDWDETRDREGWLAVPHAPREQGVGRQLRPG
jgi:hypothetical protein